MEGPRPTRIGTDEHGRERHRPRDGESALGKWVASTPAQEERSPNS